MSALKSRSKTVPRSGVSPSSAWHLFDSIPTITLLLDQAGAIRYGNHAAEALFDGDRIAPGKNLHDLLSIDDRAVFKARAANAILSGKTQTLEVPMTAAGGAVRHLRLDLQWMGETTHSQGCGLLVSAFDITDYRLAEIERQEWEQRWEKALVSSKLGVWDHNFRTEAFYYSDTWKLLRGYPADHQVDASFTKWLEKVHPDDQGAVIAAIERQNSGVDPQSVFQYRERHRDGHWIWIECRGAATEWFDDGRPARIMGTDVDVTASKQAEEDYAALSRRLQLALDISRIGVFEADLERGLDIWDDRLLEIYGVPDTDNTKQDNAWHAFVHPDDQQRIVGNAADSRQVAEPTTSEYRIIRPDGLIRHIRARVAHYRDSDGTEKCIGANWDVTADVEIREKLEQANRLAEARYRELEQAKVSMEYNALHDFLTGLPNRRFLDDMLDRRLDLPENENGLGLLHIDLDRFKQINDTLGHRAGDALLVHAAEVLQTSTETGDFVARIGGDEFVVLAPYGAMTGRFARMAQKIIDRISEPVTLEGHVCRIGASVGIALDPGADAALSAGQLMQNADIALYRAKGQGRNRFEFFTTAIQTEVIHRKRITDDIIVALEERQFVPFYQLQFDAATLEVAGAETLVRWDHPIDGLLTPDAFLAIAEDLGAVAAIDGQVMDQALADFNRWRDLGIAIPRVSVNVSARRLADPDLAAKLKGYTFEPGTLAFELLETIFLDDCDDVVRRNLEAIRALGIEIEIDDFGTGHASIVSLLNTSPTTLKIDRGLIRSINVSEKQRTLVRSIIEIGKSLNIRVLAEGVKTCEHVQILRDLGCDLLQGYALARPVPFDAVTKMVQERSWIEAG